jgi:hypothetical protein
LSRLNFRPRLTQCQCAPAWIYEYWVIRVANARSGRDTFLSMTPSFVVDERTHLYDAATTLRNGRR